MKTVEWNQEKIKTISSHLLVGKVAVVPTDTLYGLVAAASNEEAVKRVYRLKNRSTDKKCIVLISSVDDLKMFEIETAGALRDKLDRYWPGKISIELPCSSEKMKYLRRGTNSLSFRFPDDKLLCKLLERTGPLVAPSANPEGLEPATQIEIAQSYFADESVMFVDGGEKVSPPSTIISLLDEEVKIIRG